MEDIITLDKTIKNENVDKFGNKFNVYYLFSTKNTAYTAYDNTKGLNTLSTNIFFKLHYNEKNANGKVYRNIYLIEPLLKDEYEKLTQTNNVVTTCNTSKPVDTESLIKTVEEESKNIFDKRISELSKDEELQAFKLILAELIKGINNINKTLDNLVVSNTISKTLTPTPLKKEIIREPVDTTPCVTSSEALTYGLPF